MRLVLACLAALTLAAPAEQAVRINAPHEGVVDLRVGQKLEVALAGNASTGYTWKALAVPEGVSQVGDAVFVQDPADDKPGEPPMVGRGGRYILTFVAAKAVEGTIKLGYLRPWEKDIAPAQTAEVRVRVIAR